MSDETPVPGELAIEDHLAGYRLDEIIAREGMAVVYRAFANLAVIDVQRALHQQPALTGFLRTGSTPRQFALEPGGGRLLVVDTGSGQVQAVKIGHLT